VNNELKAQGFGGGGNRGGFGGGGNRGGANGGGRRTNGGGPGGSGTAGGGAGGPGGSASGEVVSTVAQQGGQQGGGGFGQGGFGGMQVSDADCKKIDDILKAHPKEKKQIDDLRAKMQALRPAGFGGGNRRGGDSTGGGNRVRNPGDTTQRRRGAGFGGRGGDSGGAQGGGQQGGGGFRGSPEMQAINEQLRAIYTQLNIDPRTAGACARRAQGGNAGQSASASGSPRQRSGQGGRGGALTPSPEMSARPTRQRTGLVFTSDSAKTSFHPRIVQLGQANLDYTEVLSGLKEGERVVMLGALALQAQRLQQQDRIRQNASPLGGQQPGPGGGGGPRGGGGRGG
jgi:hypothetical protein